MYIFVIQVQNFYRITVGLKDSVETKRIEGFNRKLNKDMRICRGGNVSYLILRFTKFVYLGFYFR